MENKTEKKTTWDDKKKDYFKAYYQQNKDKYIQNQKEKDNSKKIERLIKKIEKFGGEFKYKIEYKNKTFSN